MIHFVQLLNTEDIPVEEIAEEFLKIYRDNRDEGIADFVELLFHAGGWTTFVYLGGSCAQRQQFEDIKSHIKGINGVFPPMTNIDTNFQRRFSEFLTIILESNKCCLMYDTQFMIVVIKAFQILSTEKWDMLRLIAQLLGTRMLYSLNKEYERLKAHYIEDISNPLSLSRIHCEYQSWQQTFFKIYHLVQIYVYKSLFECQEAEGIVDNVFLPFWLTNLINELMVYISSPSSATVKDRWLLLILHGLRDKNVEHKGLCYMVLYLLLCRPMDIRWQMKLFSYVKSDLFYALRMHSDMALISMRIITSAVRSAEIQLNGQDIETIYFYLYDSDQTLAILAADYIFSSQFTDVVGDSSLIISRLVEVSRESFMKCEELLIDAIYDNIHSYITWASWVKVLTNCSEDDVTDMMSMFYAYIRKATTGFIPRLRTTIVKEMSTQEITKNRCGYTNFFIKGWFILLEVNKITLNPKALCKLIKIIQYFDEATIAAEEDTIQDLAKVCLAYIAVGYDNNLEEECCRSLAKLREFSKGNSSVNKFVSLIMNSASNIIFKDFNKLKADRLVNLSHSQILSATNSLDFDDSELWDVSMEALEIASAQRINQNLIKILIYFLFHLLIKRAKCALSDFAETKNCNLNTINVFVNRCLSRSLALQSTIRVFVGQQFHADIRKAAFSTLLNLREFLGPPPPPVDVKELFEDDVHMLTMYTLQMMVSSKNCQDNRISHARLEECCSVILKFCTFVTKGVIGIQHATQLIRYLGTNQIHDDIIVECINKYARAFPHKWELLSNTIFNAYIILKNECLPGTALKDSPETREALSRLYKELMTLTEVITRRIKFSNSKTLRKVSIRFHTTLIDLALKPTGFFRPPIELLYSIRELLADEDIQLILSLLDEYQNDYNADLAKYYNFLKHNASTTCSENSTTRPQTLMVPFISEQQNWF